MRKPHDLYPFLSHAESQVIFNSKVLAGLVYIEFKVHLCSFRIIFHVSFVCIIVFPLNCVYFDATEFSRFAADTL